MVEVAYAPRNQRNTIRTWRIALLLGLAFWGQHTSSMEEVATVGLVAPIVLDDVIEKAGNEGNYLIFSAASELKLVIETLRRAAHDVLGDGLRGANNTQQQVFDNVNRSVQLLEGALDAGLSDAEAVVDQVHQLTQDLKPWGSAPVVIRAQPLVVAPGSDSPIFVEVRGLNFAKSNPQLIVRGKPIDRVRLEQTRAVFSMARDHLLWSDDHIEVTPAELVLTFEDCDWIIFCDEERHEFDNAFLSLPANIAQLEVSTTRVSEQRVYADREFHRLHQKSTGDLTRWKCEKESQGPHEPGYFIDTDSLGTKPYEVTCNNSGFLGRVLCPTGKRQLAGAHGRAGHNWQWVSRTPTGYTVELCAQSQMHTMFEKRNGEMNVNLAWREYRMSDVREPGASRSASLRWQETFAPEAFPLDTEAVTIRAKFFDGREQVFVGNAIDRYIDVSWNAGTKQLLVKAKAPRDVGGLN